VNVDPLIKAMEMSFLITTKAADVPIEPRRKARGVGQIEMGFIATIFKMIYVTFDEIGMIRFPTEPI
jgi:hypothetical protein